MLLLLLAAAALVELCQELVDYVVRKVARYSLQHKTIAAGQLQVAKVGRPQFPLQRSPRQTAGGDAQNPEAGVLVRN